MIAGTLAARSGSGGMTPQPDRVIFPARRGGRAWWGRYVELSEQAYGEIVAKVEAAKGDARSALSKIEDHTRECERKYNSIERSLSYILKLAVGIMITMIGWMAIQLYPPPTASARGMIPFSGATASATQPLERGHAEAATR